MTSQTNNLALRLLPLLPTKLQVWLKHNQQLLINTLSLIGTTAITSGLGFVYWWVAAKFFSQTDVGLASGANSSMTLIATMGIMGLGSLLVGELAQKPEHSRRYIAASLYVSGIVGVGLGMLFLLLLPLLSPNLQLFMVPLPAKVLFIIGIVLTTWSNIMDQAVIGLLKGGLQFWRNAFFSIGKLILLVVAGLIVTDALSIYFTWVVGLLLSLTMVWWLLARQGVPSFGQADWTFIRQKGKTALSHHALNLLLKLPSLVMPIIIVTLLSPAINASFYSAWMIASFSFVVPGALTTVLFAVGAANTQLLTQKIRFTLRTSFLTGVVSTILIVLLAHSLLLLFGSNYAKDAEFTLQVLAFGVFPMTIREHYIAICRIHREFKHSTRIIALSDFIQLSAITAGVLVAGLNGLVVAWLITLTLECVFTAPLVYHTARGKNPAAALTTPS